MIHLPPAEAPRVSVIIVSTGGFDLVAAALRSIARFGPATIPFETIVVLNEPAPDMQARLDALVSGPLFVRSPVNLGIAGAGNLGRSLARGEFLLLFHDDSEAEPGWMEALVTAADEHPEAGAVGGKVLNPDGTLQHAGWIIWRDGRVSLPWFGDPPPATAFDQRCAADFCGSSSLLVRADAWDAIGGLEEDFYPAYCVDVDLGMALRNVGYIVLYEPASRTRHRKGASTSSELKRFAKRRNREAFVKKWRTGLEAHEPREHTQAALDLATRRALAFAETCRRAGPPKRPAADRRPIDAAAHERKHCEKDREFQKAFIAHLTQALAKSERRAGRRGLLARLRRALSMPRVLARRSGS